MSVTNYRMVFGLLLCVAVAICATVQAEEVLTGVSEEQYAEFMAGEVLDTEDLADGAELQRRFYNRITPPGISWLQPMTPSIAPFDANNFTDQFLDDLLGEDKNSVAIYPLSISLDSKNRDTLVYNAEGKLIATVPAVRNSREWPKGGDPSRVTLLLDLLPSEDVEPYLYVEDRIEESLAVEKARTSRRSSPVQRSLGLSEFGISAIEKLTNGSMRITASNVTSMAELYAYSIMHTSSVSLTTWTNDEDEVVVKTNIYWTRVSACYGGIESEWECLASGMICTNGVVAWEDSNISSNARFRIYAAAKQIDSDSDGLTDGEEIYIQRTDPNMADTDGDGMDDGWEVENELNPFSGLNDDLIGWWKFDDETGTNAINSATDDYHGVLQEFSGTTNSGWVEDGLLDGALYFDGMDDWVRITQSPLMLTGGPLTVSAQVWLDGNCTSDWPEVVSDLVPSSYNGYCLGFDSDYSPFAMMGAAGWIEGTNSLADQWVWVVLEYDGTNMSLYCNEEIVGSPASASFVPSTNGYLAIGNGQDTGYTEYWKGMIDDVRIYQTAIGTNGLASLYDAFDDPDGDGLTNLKESQLGLKAKMIDSDNDGLDDGDELYIYGTDPTDWDSDNDGMPDGWEIDHGFDPWDSSDASGSADYDSLTNLEEYLAGTDPHIMDTDGDGTGDINDDSSVKECTLHKQLSYQLPYFKTNFPDGTGEPVYAATVEARPSNFVWSVRTVTNVTLDGSVDDQFEINGTVYAGGLERKSFDVNITDSVTDMYSASFDVDVYDYIDLDWAPNYVELSAYARIQYTVPLSLDLSVSREETCWSSGGTFDVDQFLSTGLYTSNQVEWTIRKLGGASASINSDGLVSFGYGGGQYRVRASSEKLNTCYDMMTLVVPHVDIEQATTNVCIDCGCTVTLDLTANSYSPGGYVWSGSLPGISGTGSSFTFSPSNYPPGTYTIKARSKYVPSCYDECTVNILKVDLDVDSDNDGTIEEADDLLELNTPGKLVHLNHDDDNKNDTEDRTENSAAVTGENDLQILRLALTPTLSVGELILSTVNGGSRVHVWKNATKGIAGDQISLPKTWVLGTDTVPSVLYVEGIDEGDVQLKLAYEMNSSELCCDEVKMGVVKVDFRERSDTQYGYDDGTVDDNPVPVSADHPPQKYDWVNVDKDNKTTDIDVEITPSAYAQYIHFVASDTAKATCNPSQATANPQKLTITGKAVGQSHILARMGTTSGAEGARLNVASYQLAGINANFYKVQATGLVPDATTGVQIESGANQFMKRGVSEASITDNGTLTVEYDDNTNSVLDIDLTPSRGSEWQKVITVVGSTAGLKLIHVKALRVELPAPTGWVNANGVSFGDWTVVTDTSPSKERTAAHELLHSVGIHDTGPPASNLANIMYYAGDSTKYFVGYFKVERVQTGSAASYNPKQYEIQWDSITR
jgi:Concanavalin A-like lectin/glucanases superfamily/Bacterial TSP3 repeat